MLTSRNIKVLHLEPTDVCQASCPSCARETDQNFNRSWRHHLTIDNILSHLAEDDIKKLDKMFMCGDYGDPAAGRHTLEIYLYFRSVNPHIVLGMNTNGAIQNTNWWQELGKLFNQSRDYVVFSIDGLEDTNHLYRRGVNWKKLIENAQSFIGTGASAHWDMLIYRHNEHQIDDCQALAKDMGFKWFRAKVSKRPLSQGLEFPINWKQSQKTYSTINCHALEEQSIYIDAQGRCSPCCWLGNRQKDFVQDISQVRSTWSTPSPHPVCRSTCGTIDSQSNFKNQWRREVQLC